MMELQRTSECLTWSIQVAPVGCCRWSDACNWSLRVCCSHQLCILKFGSMNTHLMTLQKNPPGLNVWTPAPNLPTPGACLKPSLHQDLIPCCGERKLAMLATPVL